MTTIPQAGIQPSISIAILGSGGSGVMTTGSLLLEVAGRAGWYGMMTRSSGPQIRGGEAAALLRLSPQPTETHKDHFDLLLALDWLNADRFVGEVMVGAQSLIVGDEGKPRPEAITAMGGIYFELPLTQTAKQTRGGRINMVALGALASMIGLPLSDVIEVLTQSLQHKGQEAVDASITTVQAGSGIVQLLPALPTIGAAPASGKPRWKITGNEATGLGAIRGGIRFVAAYPITPATEVLEWMAPTLIKVGGVLVQAEDELASINHLIGSSFGGTPSMTATSGPGLSLMTETIGLAVASETPVVVVNVMRGGPSTGIPTKSEQSDLNIALYGLHGDAPHLVVAPNSVADCVFTAQWATHLAETLQTACIMLSDQFMGQTRAIIDRPADIAFVSGGRQLASKSETYFRYAVNDSGISPMSLPGTPGCQYTGDGLEHNPEGNPSSRAEDHIQQLDKRKRKLDQFNYGDHWADRTGAGKTIVITWGSSTGAVQEALEILQAEGHGVRLLSLRLLSPIQPERMRDALDGVTKILVVEQSHGAQFYHYLRAFYELPGEIRSMAIPGPLMIKPSDVYHELRSWGNS